MLHKVKLMIYHTYPYMAFQATILLYTFIPSQGQPEMRHEIGDEKMAHWPKDPGSPIPQEHMDNYFTKKNILNSSRVLRETRI